MEPDQVDRHMSHHNSYTITMTVNIHSTIIAEVFADIPTHARVVANLKREVGDDEVSRFRNLRSLSASDWEKFNCSTGVFDDTMYDDDDDEGGGKKSKKNNNKKKRKVHAPRSYHYKIGNLKASPYYTDFLSDSVIRVPGASDCTVRELTRKISLRQKSTFRSWFRMPLYKVEQLASRLVIEKVLTLSHHCRTEEQLKLKAELLVMGSLAILGGAYTTFKQIPTLTKICETEHSKFFLKFVHFLWRVRDEYIFLPKDREQLQIVMKRYEEMGLPGAMGSVDVVHVKWSKCPAGDYNRAKGKESYPSLAFECISNFDRRICSVFGPSFGSRNDKHIVKNDPGVRAVSDDWYSSELWNYFDEDGNVCAERGVYLICDNGYLQWPTLICPFMRSETNGPFQTCYSGNLESVRKDVECVFGILKGRFTSLDNGLKHRDIHVCERIFVACCVLHNMMLDEMVREEPPARVGRGCHMPTDSVWLDGPTVLSAADMSPRDDVAKKLRHEFHRRRNILAMHVAVWKVKCKNGEIMRTTTGIV